MASSNSEGATNDAEKTPTKRKHDDNETGDDADEDDAVEVPKVKRSPGRPKGSKNKTTKEKPEVEPGPKRPRGRPKKWPPAEKPSGPKRKRGRPKKNPDPVPAEVKEK